MCGLTVIYCVYGILFVQIVDKYLPLIHRAHTFWRANDACLMSKLSMCGSNRRLASQTCLLGGGVRCREKPIYHMIRNQRPEGEILYSKIQRRRRNGFDEKKIEKFPQRECHGCGMCGTISLENIARRLWLYEGNYKNK